MSKRKLNLQIPANLDEEKLIQVIKEVAPPHCRKYSFPGHTEEDMMQIAIMEGIDGAHRWDGKRPLKNFLSIHIRNRLYNYKRNNYSRMEAPCKKCPLKAYLPPDGCSAYKSRMDCDLFKNWYDKNQDRQNINNAMGFEVVSDIHEKSMKSDVLIEDELDTKQLVSLIDDNISGEFRKDYLIYINGGKLSHRRLEELINHIQEILCQQQEKPEN